MLQRLAGPSRGLRAACAGAMLLVTSCGGCEEDRLEVYPLAVHLPANQAATFEVTAHFRRSHGSLGPGSAISWALGGPASSDIGLSGTTGDRIEVKVSATAPPGSRFELTARAGSLQETLTVETATIGVTADLARAPHVDGLRPEAVLFTGFQGSCRPDNILSFVQLVPLGEWEAGCTGADDPRAIDFGLDRSPATWRNYAWKGPNDAGAPDLFDATVLDPISAAQSAQPRFQHWPAITVPLQVFVLGARLTDPVPVPGGGSLTVAGAIGTEVSMASARFTEALAGVLFTYSPGNVTEIPATVGSCEGLYQLLASNPAWQDPAAMNVYYVPSLSDAGGSRPRGYQCFDPSAVSERPTPPNLILISLEYWTGTSLPHELGHALGLGWRTAYLGHTDEVVGLSSDNIMWGGGDLDAARARYRLTIGQVYRVNFDQRSWLNNPQFPGGPGFSQNCGCDPYQRRPCPPLTADVRPIGNAGASLPGGTCP